MASSTTILVRAVSILAFVSVGCVFLVWLVDPCDGSSISDVLLDESLLEAVQSDSAIALGQVIENVRFLQPPSGLVLVFYDLRGSLGGVYRVQLHLSIDGGATFPRRPVSVAGDVGDGIASGNDKLIVWDAHRDVDTLTVPQAVFRIVAQETWEE